MASKTCLDFGNNKKILLDVNIKGLGIASLNVNGLRNTFKRNAIFEQLKNSRFDVTALQESHLLKEDINKIKSHWDGPIIFSEGTNNSKGLCFLFHKSFLEDDIETLHTSDRLLVCSVQIGEEKFLFANVYAPNNNNDKKQFFHTTSRYFNENLSDLQRKKLIIMGDFNCVADNKKDIVSGFPHAIDTVKSFNMFIDNNNLIDLWRQHNLSKIDFSWSRHNPFVARRIDYIFANQFLIPFINKCEIKSLGHSDHRAVYCQLEFYDFQRGKGSYKMNDKLFEDSIFKETVRKLIKENIEILSDIDPILKWSIIKIRVRELCQQFGKFEITNLKDKLNKLESELAKEVNDDVVKKQILETKHKLEILNIEKAEAAKLRSKVQWIEDGEKCTSYFLGLEKHRAVSNTVFRIKNNEGIEIIKETEIVEVFANHFGNVYNNKINNNEEIENNMNKFLENVTLKKIKDIDCAEIDKEISIEELKLSLNTLNKKSSPGYDGFTMEFYNIYFEDIKELLLEFYNACFEKGALDEQTQLGLISLIHKGNSLARDEVKYWRPITLSNIDYKIIAKLLANRIKKVMNEIVGKQQQGFIKNRNIANIIRAIDDILEYERIKNLDNLLFVIDFKQAFDKINNHFILKVFEKFGFGKNFLRWLETILRNRKSCVKNGGHLSSFFEVHCGVKQGCPIAPLLFVLGAEILAQNIIQDQSIVGVQYPNQTNSAKIQQFADDTTFFL